jgi:hypothetical protein
MESREISRGFDPIRVDGGRTMRRLLGVMIVGWALGLAPGSARAQVFSPVAVPYRINGYYAAPGYYGMSYGSPSYGMTRTYTSFSSPYGAGYGAGYAPYGLLPGRYGVGLWRPGFVTPGYLYGASYYRSFPVAYPNNGVYPPAVGVYAPGFGPAAPYAW